MFGGLVRHFFLRFLGIDQPKGKGGYRDALLLAPVFPQGLASAEGTLNTPHGRIEVRWHRENASVCYTVTIPEGLPTTLLYGGEERTLASGETHTIFL